MLICDSEAEVEKYWELLSDGGTALMELDAYPWSKKYGWIQDKFQVSWQLYLGEIPKNQQRLVPTLMFMHQNSGKAQQAMDFYTSIFPNSQINGVLHYGENAPEVGENPENVQHADFELENYSLYCMDSSFDHKFDFNEGISLVKITQNQEETDKYWNALTANGGAESQCGWCKDQFGVSWQIVPKQLMEMAKSGNQQRIQNMYASLFQMKKIDIATLEKAYNQ